MRDVTRKIPWGKVTAPMIPVILVDCYLGRFIKDIYSINLAENVSDSFPTDTTFYIFLIANFVIIAVYLLVSVFGQINQEKINALRTKLEPLSAEEV